MSSIVQNRRKNYSTDIDQNSIANKQNNKLKSSTFTNVTAQSLNYKFNHTSGLAEHDSNCGDDRVRILTQHQEQIEKMREHQLRKHKEEMGSMMKRTIMLESSVMSLEQLKIQNQQEISYLKSKIKSSSQKNHSLQQKIRQLSDRIEQQKNNIDIQAVVKVKQAEIKHLQQRNQKLNEQIIKIRQEGNKKIVCFQRQQKQMRDQIRQKDIMIAKNEQLMQVFRKNSTKIEQQNNQKQRLKQQRIYKLESELKLKCQYIQKMEKNYEQVQQMLNTSQNRLGFNKKQQNLAQQVQFKLKNSQQMIEQLKQSCLKWQNQYKKIVQSRDGMEKDLFQLKAEINKLRQAEMDAEKSKRNYQTALQQTKKQLLNAQIKLKQNQLMQFKMQQKAEIQKKLRSVIDEMAKNIQIGQQKWKQDKKRYSQILEKYNAGSKQCEQMKISLKQQKQKNEQILQQLQASRQQYQKALSIQSSKNKQFQQLVICLKQKINEYQQNSCNMENAYEAKAKKIEQQRQKLLRQVIKFKSEIANYEGQLDKLKKQSQVSKQMCQDKQRQFQRKIRCIQDEKNYLNVQIQKWKSLRNQSAQQFQQIKRQNRKLKGIVQQHQQAIVKYKLKLQLLGEQQLKIKHLQQQKIAINQKYETELSEIKRLYEAKLQEATKENVYLQQKIKAKLQSDMQNAHREQVARIKRKSQDSVFTANRYEKKIEDLQIVVQEFQRNSRVQLQKFKRQMERKDKEQQVMAQKYEQSKKKMIIYREQYEDLDKKFKQRDRKIQQLISKLKKSENTISRYEYQLEQLESSMKQLQKIKRTEQQKRKNLQRTISKYQTEQILFENEISSLNKQLQKQNYELGQVEQSQKKKLQEINLFKEQSQKLMSQLSIIKAKYERLLSQTGVLKETNQRFQKQHKNCQVDLQKTTNQLKILKQKSEIMDKKRKQLFHKFSNLSNEHFSITIKQNQLQFIMTLYQKLKSYIQITQTINQDRIHMKKDIKVQNQQLLKSYAKNFDESLSFKQNYNSLYKKYTKYKQAYIYMRNKLQRHRVQVINDQKYTEEIINHCKNFLPKIQ